MSSLLAFGCYPFFACQLNPGSICALVAEGFAGLEGPGDAIPALGSPTGGQGFAVSVTVNS